MSVYRVSTDAWAAQCSGRLIATVRMPGVTTVRCIFAGLPVADYASAYDWYVGLLGRPADMFPHDREAVWRSTASAAVYVVQDPNRAGSGLLTLAVDDLDTEERRLREAGLSIAELVNEGAPRRLVVTDPDGNTLTFFQDPAEPDT